MESRLVTKPKKNDNYFFRAFLNWSRVIRIKYIFDIGRLAKTQLEGDFFTVFVVV